MQRPSGNDPIVVESRREGNPGFWIRMVKPGDARLTVTDMLAGGLSEPEMGRALSDLLDAHAGPSTAIIEFADLSAEGDRSQSDKREVCRRFDVLSLTVRRWAKGAGRTVSNGYLDFRLGTYSAVFTLV